jgi:tetratricopeptide (TPR) repeat protein
LDWTQLTGQYQPLDGSNIPLFAPPRDMGQAVAIYNRALFNIQNDNSDMAIIALRKLTALYPSFAQASALLGFCLAATGQLEEARDKVAKAVLAGLPGDLQPQAETALAEIDRQQALQTAAFAASKSLPMIRPGKGVRRVQPAANQSSVKKRRRPGAVAAAPILEKTGRSARVRVASERERQNIVQQGNSASPESNRINIRRRPADYLSVGLPILAGAIVIGLLVWGGVALVPRWIEQARQRSGSFEKLGWLLAKLEDVAGQDAAIDRILRDYEAQFNPTPSPALTTAPGKVTPTEPVATTTHPAASESTTTPGSEATTTASTSVAPTGTTAATTGTPTVAQTVLDLRQASLLYDEAQSVRSSDLLAAADKLLAARHLLADIPSGTTAPDVAGDATAISQSVETMIGEIATTAAYRYWQAGQTPFENAQYEAALVLFLKSYELNPNCYGGSTAYYCGRCYQLLGDKVTAKTYYDYVMTHFPGRDIAASAAARLEQMGY